MAGRHHYVSRFHLRGFVDPAATDTPDPWLWVGDFQQHTVVRRSPGNIGWQRGLFDGQGGFANHNLSLESHLSKEVEGPAAGALRKWARLPQGQRGTIPAEVFRYLTWAAARGLPMLQLYEDWLSDLPPNVQCVEPPPPGFENIRWGGGRHHMEHPTYGIRDDIPSEQVHAMRSQGWRVRLTDNEFRQVLHFQAWYFQVRMFPRLQWMILDSPPGEAFIIADRPVVWGFAEFRDAGLSLLLDVPPSALRDPRVQLVAPLTRSIALFAFHASAPPPERIRPIDVNRIVASGAHRWVAGPAEAAVAAALMGNR